MKKLLVAIFAMSILCFALVGCSSGGGSEDNTKNFIGKWEAESAVIEGEEYDSSMMDFMRSMDLNIVLTLTEDSASLDAFGEILDGTWEATDATTGKASIGGEDFDLSLDGDKLTLTQGDSDNITFVLNNDAKASSTEAPE